MAGGDDRKVLVMGTRPYAAVFADVLSECALGEVAGFIENMDQERCTQTIQGLPIYWIGDIGPLAVEHVAICSLGTTRRDVFVQQVAQRGMVFAKAVHRTAHLSRRSQIEEGTCLDAGVIVAGFTKIGQHVRVNRGVTIGHHTIIHDFVTIQPGVNVAGNCVIGRQTYIGMGANVLDGITVGQHCVIGAGALVTKDLPDRVMALGVPAKIVKERIEGM